MSLEDQNHASYIEKQAIGVLENIQFSSVQSLSRVWLFATPWTAAHQASLSITNSRSPPKPMSIESVMPSNHFILYCPLLLSPSFFPSIRVFSNESALRFRWPKYWSFTSTSVFPMNIQDWSPLGWTEKGMANHFSIPALRTPRTVWKGRQGGC